MENHIFWLPYFMPIFWGIYFYIIFITRKTPFLNLFCILFSLILYVLDFKIDNIIVILIAVITWQLGKERDREQKKANIRLEHLTKIYKQIAMCYMRAPADDLSLELKTRNLELQKGMQEAVIMLQLYGEKEEIRVLHELISNNEEHCFSPLLIILRQRLRKELMLSSINSTIIHYREKSELEILRQHASAAQSDIQKNKSLSIKYERPSFSENWPYSLFEAIQSRCNFIRSLLLRR